jgi:hypothetical protein
VENEMTFRLLCDRILVRRINAKEKTAGGLIIPGSALTPLNLKAGGPDPVRQMVRYGNAARRRGSADHEGSDVMGVIEASEVAQKAA